MFSLGFIFMVKDSRELSIIFVPLVPEQTPMVEVFSVKTIVLFVHVMQCINILGLLSVPSLLFQEVCPELRPRLCVIQRGSNGYGFNLHSERARPGQYIRAVDVDSPAERAGLLPKDRIVQVHYFSVHKATILCRAATLQSCCRVLLVAELLCGLM